MQSVVVTGVSTGIGWGIAKVMTRKEFRIFGSVRKQADAERLRAELGVALRGLSGHQMCGLQGTQSASARFLMSERSLLIDRFCFEIRHIAFRHRKPQDDLPADFVLGACQSDVAQLNYVQG